jgi:hypothetical protein
LAFNAAISEPTARGTHSYIDMSGIFPMLNGSEGNGWTLCVPC